MTPVAPEPKRRANATQTTIATVVAAAVATASSAGISSYQAGNSKTSVREEIKDWVSQNFVTRDSSETRANALSTTVKGEFDSLRREITDMRMTNQRSFDDLKEATRDVPKMAAQLDLLQQQQPKAGK